MKAILLTIIPFLIMAVAQNTENVYQFELNSIEGKEVSLQDFEGSLLLIVNTASECGFTRQYSGLQKLHEKFNDKDFYVLGFPSNNFGGQEPGTDEEILEFCKVNFGVDFPLFSRSDVKGENSHPLFRYLTNVENPDFTGDIRWNFEKFLINRNGNLVHRFRSNVEPDSKELLNAIESYL